MAADRTMVGAVGLRDRLASGALRAVELAEDCLARVGAVDEKVRAWAWLDRDHVLQQARALDVYRASGRPLGPLHGLPVAIKDIIDTAGVATENGSRIDSGRVPANDAAVVERLKAAGAIIMGKAATTELAFLHPAKTTNPANTGHTPGGSSAGSAAAVAAGMVPLAIGTQTAGSVIRPAAFCGITGFKPTFGAISRRGILAQSPSLDTVGVMGRDPEDVALLAEALFGHDPLDRSTAPAPHPRLLECVRAGAPLAPTFAFVRTPYWERADPQMREALEELVDLLGENCAEVELPAAFAESDEIRKRIQFAELAKCYHRYLTKGEGLISDELREAAERGARLPARDYISALDWSDVYVAALEQVFSRWDFILTPAAKGPAPEGLASTGDPVFNGLWTLCRMPAVTIPLFEAENGLPMGVQLVGRRGDDGRLLRAARWLADFVTSARD
ncbi:MAG: amidase [Rhizobiales bacterium]|nr:amidase [Hyphomicrobiales bacterium]